VRTLSRAPWFDKRTPRGRGNAKSVKQSKQNAPYPVPQNATNSAGQRHGSTSGTASVPLASGAPVKRSGTDGSWWKRTPRGRGSAKSATYGGQAATYPVPQNTTAGAGKQQGYGSGPAPAASGAPVKRAGGAAPGHGGYSGGNAGNRTGEYVSKAVRPTAPTLTGAAPPYATAAGKPKNGANSSGGKTRRELYANDFAVCQKDSYPETKWLYSKHLTCCCPDQYETLSGVKTNAPVCKDLANGISPAPQLPPTTVKACKEGWKVSETFPACCEEA
jgi:hypothetical protein